MLQKTTGMTMTFPVNVTTERTEKQHRPDELLITGTEERIGGLFMAVGNRHATDRRFGNTSNAFYILLQEMYP